MRVFVLTGLLILNAVADTAVDELSTWRQLGDTVWRFGDGGAEAGPGEQQGFLVSPAAYGDFHLTMEFWIADDTNSGIFFRCPKPATSADVNPGSCYEVNIWDQHPNQDSRTGGIVGLAAPKVHVDTVRRWNRYDIVVRGAAIKVTLNDEVVVDLENDRLTAGYIALQYGGTGTLKIRNLRLLE